MKVFLLSLKVFQAKWWAGMYGAATWKLHTGWSNAPTVQCLNLGKLTRKWKRKISCYGVKSARTYRNQRGKKAFHGTKSLRATGTLGISSALLDVCLILLDMGTNIFFKNQRFQKPLPFPACLCHDAQDISASLWPEGGETASTFLCQAGDRHRGSPRDN